MEYKIYEKLSAIQIKAKIPKSRVNTYSASKFKYRSLEDILNALKPLCDEENVTLVLSDDIVNIGDRFYLKATAKLTDQETGETICNHAFARESLEKNGMDPAQLTGTCSSYARKYALNGLFCIDDSNLEPVKDIDDIQAASKQDIDLLKTRLNIMGWTEKMALGTINKNFNTKIFYLNKISQEQCTWVIDKIDEAMKEKNKNR